MSATRGEDLLDYNERLFQKLISAFDDKIDDIKNHYTDYEVAGCEDKLAKVNAIRRIMDGIDWDGVESIIEEMETIEEEVEQYEKM